MERKFYTRIGRKIYADTVNFKFKKQGNFATVSKRSDDPIKLYKEATRRRKKRFRVLSECNSGMFFKKGGNPIPPISITLTFAENITNHKFAFYEFTKFNKRFNYAVFGQKSAKLKYVRVPEFQKRGSIHFHCIYFNLPYIKDLRKLVADIWEHGFIKIRTVNNYDYVINYVAKDFNKAFGENKEIFGRSYSGSRGLYRPEKIDVATMESILPKINPITLKSKSYDFDFGTFKRQELFITKEAKNYLDFFSVGNSFDK